MTLSNENFILNNNNFTLFPNPSKTIVQIKSKIPINSITLFDILGKAIVTQTQNTNEINVEQLPKGLYLLEVSIQNQKYYGKFIKE